ncbi:MAG: tRNA (N6-isopentenyl adenosine(37)-C2)-methylthiotransferase MiaB [Rikenellaceae bacterium]|nr:tRNA (N6-isopentenyl adenosine(37)-C2)-methylthiotransferase MiaB [Rikenellaceae bacterium]
MEILRPGTGNGQKIYIETYGCQMNVNDSEVVVSILKKEGYRHTENISEADIIFINTCSIRDNAEQRIWGRLRDIKQYKKNNNSLIVGIIGCMAERLKEDLIEKEKLVDIIAGPDSYRELPVLIRTASDGSKAVNVELSKEETYAEISPVRLGKDGISAFVSIMRGCNNMCSYCVVPYTRGRERSRDPETILNEINDLVSNGYKEVTLLGQNVNSYNFNDDKGNQTDFSELLRRVASVSPELRVRFSTSHPKDLSDEVLYAMRDYNNICKSIHLPAQSGSNSVLKLMNRKYTREWYLDRIGAIKRIIPECEISTDLIAGFCGETEEDHKGTLSLMESVGYSFAFMFKYSERPGTQAARNYADDVPDDVKTRRLTEIINLQNRLSLASNKKDIGKIFEVLVEGTSKKSSSDMSGRNSQNKVVVFAADNEKPGDYVYVEITDCTSATLLGKRVKK